MKRGFLLILISVLSLFTFIGTASANSIEDGTYKINYEMKEANSENTSIADGYFSKPATLTVKDGVQTIQLTVTSADMIKSLSTPNGEVSIVSEDEANKTRTVSFQVSGDLANPLPMDMHIVVPDLYDTTHTARAVFDVSGLAGSEADSGEKETSDDGAAVAKGAEENPPTGDESPLFIYVSLLVGAGALLIVSRKFRVN